MACGSSSGGLGANTGMGAGNAYANPMGAPPGMGALGASSLPMGATGGQSGKPSGPGGQSAPSASAFGGAASSLPMGATGGQSGKPGGPGGQSTSPSTNPAGTPAAGGTSPAGATGTSPAGATGAAPSWSTLGANGMYNDVVGGHTYSQATPWSQDQINTLNSLYPAAAGAIGAGQGGRGQHSGARGNIGSNYGYGSNNTSQQRPFNPGQGPMAAQNQAALEAQYKAQDPNWHPGLVAPDVYAANKAYMDYNNTVDPYGQYTMNKAGDYLGATNKNTAPWDPAYQAWQKDPANAAAIAKSKAYAANPTPIDGYMSNYAGNGTYSFDKVPPAPSATGHKRGGLLSLINKR